MKITGVSFDLSESLGSKHEWFARVKKIVIDSLSTGSDIVVFPELFTLGLALYSDTKALNTQLHFCSKAFWQEFLPDLQRELVAFPEHCVVLGSGPYHDKNENVFYNRSAILMNGQLESFDKIYLTPWETCFKAGNSLKIFNYKGLRLCPLICFDIEQPHIAQYLKKENIHLIIVPSATTNVNGSERILRTASSRAIELGCAVFVVPVIGSIDYNELVDINEGRQGLFLPAQDIIQEQKVQYSVYKTSETDICHFSFNETILKKVKENNGETKPFLTKDRTLHINSY